MKYTGGVYMNPDCISFNPDRTHSVSVKILGD